MSTNFCCLDLLLDLINKQIINEHRETHRRFVYGCNKNKMNIQHNKENWNMNL